MKKSKFFGIITACFLMTLMLFSFIHMKSPNYGEFLSNFSKNNDDMNLVLEPKNSKFTWAPHILVSTESTTGSSTPSIAVDGDGNVHVAWTDLTDYGGAGGLDYDIFYKCWNATTEAWGGHVNATDVVSTESTDNSYNPSIGVDGNGNVHVVWQDSTDYGGAGGSDYDIFYKYWNTTSGIWSGHANATDVVSTESTADSEYPSIAVDDSGNLYVVWYDSTDYGGSDTDNDIFYKCWNASSGTWGGHANETDVVSTESTADSGFPSIAVDDSRNVHVVWQDLTNYGGAGGLDYDIFYKCWNATLGAWNLTEVVSTESTENSWYPAIEVDENDNLHAVWQDLTDYGGAGMFDFDIFYKCWNATTGSWGGHVNATDVVSTESTDSSYYPSIAVDGNGNVHMVWQDATDYGGAGVDADIFYKYWNATTKTWSGHVSLTDVVSTESTGASWYPAIEAEGNGKVHVVWKDDTIFPNQIFYKTIIWNVNPTAVISTESTDSSYNPSIAVDGNGNIHVAWQDYTNYSGADIDADIFYKCWNATTKTWSGHVNTTDVISTESTDSSYDPSIAVDGNGNVHVAWRDGAGVDADIFYKFWNATTGLWGGYVNATDMVSTESTGNCYHPSIAVDGNGNVHVAWEDYTNYGGAGGSDYDIFYKCWNTTSGAWNLTEVVSTESTDSSYNPSIAVDGNGNVHVAWEDYTNYGGAGMFDLDIFYKCWNVTTETWGGHVSATDVISTESTSDSYDPSIAVDVNGNVHVAWEDMTNYSGAGADADIFYKCWNATTKTWSGHVNTTDVVSTESTVHSQCPSINVDISGNVHMAWHDFTDYGGAGGSDLDIFYKFYDILSGVWILTEVISTESAAASSNPSIVVDDSGKVHIAWDDSTNYDGSGTDSDIFYKVRDKNPTSTQPNNIITSVTGLETINWTLFDDCGGGKYRVWANDTNGDYYLLKSWSQWFNNTEFYVGINRTAVGIYNYTIEYYDNHNQFGTPDTVIVTITGDGIPTSSHPDNFSTSRIGVENVTWTLFDDFGTGQYRVWVNDTNDNYYVWKDWSSWNNGVSFNINVNHTAKGLYNYTVEYHDFYYQFGIPDSVYVTVEDNWPTSNQPDNITTNARETNNITWTLYDDCSPSFYRVWTNDTNNNYYLCVDWNPWYNNTPIDVEINRSSPGFFNYTIEFNDTYDQFTQNTVFVTIVDLIPTSNQPGDIQTTTASSDAIYWRLYDDFGPGKYRVWANDSINDYHIWIDWSSWENNTFINVPINRSAIGKFNYTIEFNSSTGQIAHDTVIVIITSFPPVDQKPTSSHPQNVITPGSGSDTIQWTLYDDIGASYYRVWVNDTSGNPYIWQDWTTWTNGIPFNVPINYTLGVFGVFNYTIEYNDSINQFGIPDTVIVTIIDSMPTCNQPGDVTTALDGSESIEWRLYDEYGAGNYRIWLNNTLYQDWTPWTNGTPIIVAIKRDGAGLFNYTIEFNSSTGQVATDTVFVVITTSEPTGSPILFGPQGGSVADFLLSPLGLGIIFGIITAFSLIAILVIKMNNKIKELDKKISKTKVPKSDSKKLKDISEA